MNITNNQSTTNNNIYTDDRKYKHKTCAGLHCNNIPTHYLKLAVIKKSGGFCTSCKRALEEDDLLLESSLAVDDKIGLDNLTLR